MQSIDHQHTTGSWNIVVIFLCTLLFTPPLLSSRLLSHSKKHRRPFQTAGMGRRPTRRQCPKFGTAESKQPSISSFARVSGHLCQTFGCHACSFLNSKLTFKSRSRPTRSTRDGVEPRMKPTQRPPGRHL
ncbi:hypothetical protein BDV09DRAFT_165747 [Aspergillus tetrazonus]